MCRRYSGRSARKRRSGDRPGTIPLRTCAALSSSFCHFTNPTGVGNLVGGAETKPPREKSFIQCDKSNSKWGKKVQYKGDVRGQEMSENTLLSFFIFSKFTFLRFAEKLRGGWKKWPTSKNPPSPAGPTRLKKNPWMVHFTPISGKNPLFFTKFQKSISWPVDEILIPNWNCQNPTQSSVEEIFYSFLILNIRLATKSKVRNTVFLRKRFFFFKISGFLSYYWIKLLISIQKKFKKKVNKIKMNFWPIFILFIYFFYFFF